MGGPLLHFNESNSAVLIGIQNDLEEASKQECSNVKKYFILVPKYMDWISNTINDYNDKYRNIHGKKGYYPDIVISDCGASRIRKSPKQCFKCDEKILAERDEMVTRILGGYNASVEEFPWIARLRNFRNRVPFPCAGTIINTKWIITSAHCISE